MNQIVEKSIEQFWKLWIGEYLGSLRKQHSYVKNKNQLKKYMICVRDIVLVSDNTPQIKWKYRLVEELIRGKDRKIWGTCVPKKNKDSQGIVRRQRPISKLHKLESSESKAINWNDPSLESGKCSWKCIIILIIIA